MHPIGSMGFFNAVIISKKSPPIIENQSTKFKQNSTKLIRHKTP